MQQNLSTIAALLLAPLVALHAVELRVSFAWSLYQTSRFFS